MEIICISAKLIRYLADGLTDVIFTRLQNNLERLNEISKLFFSLIHGSIK